MIINNILNKTETFLRKLSVSKKVIATVFLILFALSLIPIIITCFYSVPSCDDYTFGNFIHSASVNGTSFLLAAVKKATDMYMSWQGFWGSSFIAAIQPFNINTNLYFISNLTILFFIILSTLFFSYTVLVKYLNAEKSDWLIITLPLLEMFIQFMPSISEGIYWMDGSLSMYVNSVMFLIFGAVLQYNVSDTKFKKVFWFILSVVFMLTICTSSIHTFILMTLIFIFALIYLFAKHNNTKYLVIVLSAIYTIGIIIAIVAPGNAVRVEQTGMVISFGGLIKAVIEAIFYSAQYAGSWINLAFVAVFAFVTPLVYSLTKKSNYKFDKPFLVFVLSFLLYASRSSVQLFSQHYFGSGRQLNQYYWGLIAFAAISWFYFVGYISKKKDFSFTVNEKKISVCFICVILFFVGIGCLDYGAKDLTSVATGLSLYKGETQQYHKEMTERIEKVKNGNGVVTVPEISVYPQFFGEESLTDDPSYWTNSSFARYYGAEGVVLASNN